MLTLSPSGTHPVTEHRGVLPGWPRIVWLAMGVLLFLLTSKRWGTDLLTWIAPIPFLYYLRTTRGWGSRIAFVVAMVIALTLGVVKIAADDLQLLGARFIVQMGSMAALPVALIYLVWDYLRRRTSDIFGVYLFPALYVALEWYHSNVGTTGSWGGLANTQADNLALLQIGSLFGITAVTFLIAWVAALLELALARWRDHTVWRNHAAALAIVFIAVHVFGSIRLYGAQTGTPVRAVAITQPRAGFPISQQTGRREPGVDLDYHVAKTREAARQGAQLVVWSEASVRIQPEEHEPVMQQLADEARRLGIVLVATFGVDQGPPDHYIDNKFVLFKPDGTIAIDYSKHVPVPTERALRGVGPITSAATPLGRVGGAICYDFDFPWVGRALANADTGLAVAPAADWAGINPLHTKMARFRAIEGGYSLIRATNRGPSAAFDAYGRIQAWLPFSEPNDRLMVATLPSTRVFTLYAAIGDVFSYACFAWVLFVIAVDVRKRFTERARIASSEA